MDDEKSSSFKHKETNRWTHDTAQSGNKSTAFVVCFDEFRDGCTLLWNLQTDIAYLLNSCKLSLFLIMHEYLITRCRVFDRSPAHLSSIHAALFTFFYAFFFQLNHRPRNFQKKTSEGVTREQNYLFEQSTTVFRRVYIFCFTWMSLWKPFC